MKQTYEVGDRVISPLGKGEIISIRTMDKPEGQIRCAVRHDTYMNIKNKTYEVDVEHLQHDTTSKTPRTA